MIIKKPHHHNFSTNSEEATNAVPDWEISVPSEDDIEWSIVLSYLISANNKDPENFSFHLKTLTGESKNGISTKNASKAIRHFNPFKNRYACLYNKTLKKVVSKFKRRLDWNKLTEAFDKLKEAADFLDSPILLISIIDEKIETQLFPESSVNSKDPITLFASPQAINKETTKSCTTYNFMLSNQLRLKFKKSFLSHCLNEVNIDKSNLEKVLSVIQNEEHFLISILNSDVRTVLHKLYKSPYLVSKMADAGYETDPRSEGPEGLSALHYALISGDFQILYELYYFAANNCFESEEGFRNPSSSIVNNLSRLNDIFLSDLLKSNHFKDYENRDPLQKSHDELTRLNQFLLDVSTKIFNIRENLNSFNPLTGKLAYEAREKRDIIVTILKEYEVFFHPNSKDLSDDSNIDNYITYKNYYNSVDMQTAILFFDNIFYLKSRLSLKSGDLISDIESSFFLLVLVYYDIYSYPILPKDVNLDSESKYLYLLLLYRRLSNYNKAKIFSKLLQGTVLNKENIRSKIPKEEIYNTLKSQPIIKDLYEINRLNLYLKAALEVKVEDIKSVLVIERALQVIGEFMSLTGVDQYSIRQALSLYLPKKIRHVLLRIRNTLTHLIGRTFTVKFETEKNVSLFTSIQKEISQIYKILDPIFKIHNSTVRLYNVIKFQDILEEKEPGAHSETRMDGFPSYDENIKNFIYSVLKSFEICLPRFLEVFERALVNLGYIDSENTVKGTIISIRSILYQFPYLLKFPSDFDITNFKTLLELFKAIETCDSLDHLKETLRLCINECKTHILSSNKKESMELNIKHSEKLLGILKCDTFLSDEEKDAIRSEIPPSMIESVALKDKLILSINQGFTTNETGQLEEVKIDYLSKKKMKLFKTYYRKKSQKALTILETQDPIAKLEDILTNNRVDDKDYYSLCEQMEFSEKARKQLKRIVIGQKKKFRANNLTNLYNRIQLLKTILIEENDEICDLWVERKSKNSRSYLINKIVQQYLEDQKIRASTEMLLFDCMILLGQKIENIQIKERKLCGGISLRNVISHGSPLLEILCKMLDPEDLPTELVNKMLQFIEDEKVVKAILELYELLCHDSTKLIEVIKNGDIKYEQLLNRILSRKNENWEAYIKLLPS